MQSSRSHSGNRETGSCPPDGSHHISSSSPCYASHAHCSPLPSNGFSSVQDLPKIPVIVRSARNSSDTEIYAPHTLSSTQLLLNLRVLFDSASGTVRLLSPFVEIANDRTDTPSLIFSSSREFHYNQSLIFSALIDAISKCLFETGNNININNIFDKGFHSTTTTDACSNGKSSLKNDVDSRPLSINDYENSSNSCHANEDGLVLEFSELGYEATAAAPLKSSNQVETESAINKIEEEPETKKPVDAFDDYGWYDGPGSPPRDESLPAKISSCGDDTVSCNIQSYGDEKGGCSSNSGHRPNYNNNGGGSTYRNQSYSASSGKKFSSGSLPGRQKDFQSRENNTLKISGASGSNVSCFDNDCSVGFNNIHFSVRYKEFEKYIETIGEVKHMKQLFSKGRFVGAFAVCFASSSIAKRALSLNQSQVFGRNIKVMPMSDVVNTFPFTLINYNHDDETSSSFSNRGANSSFNKNQLYDSRKRDQKSRVSRRQTDSRSRSRNRNRSRNRSHSRSSSSNSSLTRGRSPITRSSAHSPSPLRYRAKNSYHPGSRSPKRAPKQFGYSGSYNNIPQPGFRRHSVSRSPSRSRSRLDSPVRANTLRGNKQFDNTRFSKRSSPHSPTSPILRGRERGRISPRGRSQFLSTSRSRQILYTENGKREFSPVKHHISNYKNNKYTKQQYYPSSSASACLSSLNFLPQRSDDYNGAFNRKTEYHQSRWESSIHKSSSSRSLSRSRGSAKTSTSRKRSRSRSRSRSFSRSSPRSRSRSPKKRARNNYELDSSVGTGFGCGHRRVPRDRDFTPASGMSSNGGGRDEFVDNCDHIRIDDRNVDDRKAATTTTRGYSHNNRAASSKSSATVIVENLDPSTNLIDIKKEASIYGSTRSVEWMDNNQGKCKIEYENTNQAQVAVSCISKLNNEENDVKAYILESYGCLLNSEITENTKVQPYLSSHRSTENQLTLSSPSNSFQRQNGYNVFVRNVPEDCTERDLKNVMRKFGPIVNIRIILRKHIAFVAFETRESARLAIEASDTEMVLGRNLQIHECHPQPHKN